MAKKVDDLVNFTPHAIVLRTHEGDIQIPPHPEGPIRLQEKKDDRRLFMNQKVNGEMKRLPVAQPPNFDGLYLEKRHTMDDFPWRNIIVSMPVAEFWKAHDTGIPGFGPPRCNVFTPDTSPGHVIRTKDGQIAGTDRLRIYVLEHGVQTMFDEIVDENGKPADVTTLDV